MGIMGLILILGTWCGFYTQKKVIFFYTHIYKYEVYNLEITVWNPIKNTRMLLRGRIHMDFSVEYARIPCQTLCELHSTRFIYGRSVQFRWDLIKMLLI